jgi:hypothetical protein
MTCLEEILFIIIIFLIVTTIIIYVYQLYSDEGFTSMEEQIQSHCNRIDAENNVIPPLISIAPNSEFAKYPLRDFNIKTAFNCCALDTMGESYVDTCALKMCLGQGVRCLDFEIYSRNNIPVIATSTRYDITSTNTLNHVDFKDALKVINRTAFEQALVPNATDPLIIHMRIMTENSQMYKELADNINSEIDKDRLLGVEHSYANYKTNFGETKIVNLLGKVIFIVNNNINVYESTRLYEFVNASSQSEYLRFMYVKDLNRFDSQNVKTYNKTKMTFLLPDITTSGKNIDSTKGQSQGCQMIGMSFQIQDENLKIYNSFFENKKSAFVLKEDNLRISLNGTRGVDEDYFKLEVEPGFGNVDNDDGANETIQPQINKQPVTQISDSKNKRIAANEVENVKMENEINQLGNTKDVNKIIDTLKKVI